MILSDPINIFHGVHQSDNEPIRLSYQRGSHYNSIVDPHKATIGVGLGLPSFNPGSAEKNLLNDAIRQSEELQIEQVCSLKMKNKVLPSLTYICNVLLGKIL